MMDVPTLTIEFEAHFRNVDIVRAALQGISSEYFGKDSERAEDIVMAANEAMNNAVEHTGSATVRIEVICSEESLNVFVISGGPPFDPVSASAGLSEADMMERDEGGYGLFLIRELVDRFEYEYRDARNIWKLYKLTSHQ